MRDFSSAARVARAGGVVWTAFWLFLFLMAGSEPVSAHQVSVFAWAEGNTVHTVSKFFGGKEVKNAMVEVFDPAGNRLIQGRTDDRGEFSFEAPQKSGLKIVVSAGMGHQGEWTLQEADFEPDPAEATRPAPGPSDARGTEPPARESSAAAAAAAGSQEIRVIVEKALDKKLAPVLRMLSETRAQKPSVRDILGGIGYIFGLAGVAAYVAGRKKKDRPGQ